MELCNISGCQFFGGRGGKGQKNILFSFYFILNMLSHIKTTLLNILFFFKHFI